MSKKILVVDDSATVRQQVGLALAQAGFEVVEAVDGIDGAAKIDRLRDLCMVICDVNMPRMSGIDMLLEVRKLNTTLPIVMLTTEGQPTLVERAKRAGAQGWIVKPFKADLLVAAVRKLTATP